MVDAFRTRADHRYYMFALAALILSAWGSLAYWGMSPYAGLLDHGSANQAQLGILPSLAAFVLGWTLMVIAMMLPSSVPLINLFGRITQNRPDRHRLVALLGLGYLGTWAWFGALVVAGDGAVHLIVDTLWGIKGDAPPVAALILLGAGIYQFTALKTMCLTQCRSPYSFLVQNWRGRRAWLSALRLGVRHGLYCLGCCWTLMLLMFAVGGVNFGWMLLLGTLMAAERTTQWGRHLTRPLGVILIVSSLLVGSGLATIWPG